MQSKAIRGREIFLDWSAMLHTVYSNIARSAFLQYNNGVRINVVCGWPTDGRRDVRRDRANCLNIFRKLFPMIDGVAMTQTEWGRREKGKGKDERRISVRTQLNHELVTQERKTVRIS